MKISKAQRDEERRRDTMRRNRLKHLLGMLLHIQVSWEHGFKGGGKAWNMSYAPVALEGRRLGMAKILLAILAVVFICAQVAAWKDNREDRL